MDIWPCKFSFCKEHVEFFCSICSPIIYLCPRHINTHQQETGHESLPMYTEPNQLSRAEVLNFLNKRLNTLSSLETLIEQTIFNEIKKIQESFDANLKNLRIVQEEYRRLIQKVSRIKQIPCVGSTKIQDCLKYPPGAFQQIFENILKEETPHGNEIKDDLYSFSYKFCLISLDFSVKIFTALGADPEMSIERENKIKSHFYELNNLIEVFKGHFTKKIPNYGIDVLMPQPARVHSPTEVHSPTDLQPRKKTYKEDVAVLARSKYSSASLSGSTASSVPSLGTSSEVQSTISDATTESAYSPYTTLSASPHSTISEHK